MFRAVGYSHGYPWAIVFNSMIPGVAFTVCTIVYFNQSAIACFPCSCLTRGVSTVDLVSLRQCLALFLGCTVQISFGKWSQGEMQDWLLSRNHHAYIRLRLSHLLKSPCIHFADHSECSIQNCSVIPYIAWLQDEFTNEYFTTATMSFEIPDSTM